MPKQNEIGDVKMAEHPHYSDVKRMIENHIDKIDEALRYNGGQSEVKASLLTAKSEALKALANLR